MEQTKAFLSALEEWKVKANPEINDFDTVLFIISYALGGEQSRKAALERNGGRPDLIQERIVELSKNQNMQEDFLISSLVKLVDEHLEHKITGLGDTIAFHLASKEDEEIRDISEEMLVKLTRPGYVYKAQKELEAWRIIAIEKLGMSNRRVWEHNRVLNGTK